MFNLEKEFNDAFKNVSEIQHVLPLDVLLRLYAYYKQAKNGDNYQLSEDKGMGIRNAFKFNAWVQLKGMSETEAMQEYIDLANEILIS